MELKYKDFGTDELESTILEMLSSKNVQNMWSRFLLIEQNNFFDLII